MDRPTLHHTQELLWKLLTAPEGAAAGLAALPVAERALAGGFVRSTGSLSALERIDIYANMYFFRIRDCLADDFSAVHTVVGDTRFHNLITDYLLQHPPSHYSLRYAGQHLPAFLTQHPLSDEYPFLSDLAALEWAIVEAFDAAGATPVDTQHLAAVPHADWPALRLALVPSAQLLTLHWRVHDVWQRCHAGESVESALAGDTYVKVWRQDLRVFHGPIDSVEMAALTALAGGAPFSDVCAQIAEHVGDAAGAEQAAALLAQWIGDGMLSMRE